MIDPQMDERAALAALGWEEDPAMLDRAAAQDAEVADALRAYAEVAALIAGEAPQHAPPAGLRTRILQAAGIDPKSAAPARSRSVAPQSAPVRRLLAFPKLPVMPYALAACLMGVALLQAGLILLLDSRIDALHPAAPRHDPFAGVQLVSLAPQGDHGDAKIMVAWNPKTCCGMVTMDKMPDPPPGRDYQLWVLDPSKPAPVDAGVVPRGSASHHFIAGEVHLAGRPGFAVSLEPSGGRPEPSGQVLFAVAPSP